MYKEYLVGSCEGECGKSENGKGVYARGTGTQYSRGRRYSRRSAVATKRLQKG